MKTAIIGCGLIGEKRAKVLKKHELVITADINLNRAEYISRTYGNSSIFTDNWKEAAGHPEVELVIVATTNNLLKTIGNFSLENGKHVLIEKPAAVSSEEIKSFYEDSLKSNRKVKVGFNHRYHPAIKKAKEIFESGDIGKPMFIRGRYGHGGRIGYDDEWRSKKEISGGGELIDQGVHLIDLSRWFLGEFEYVRGFTNTYYWNMDVEDNAFLELRTKENLTAWLHASCSEWKNMFSFEIYGRNGKLHIEGLGGSYGTEKLSYYKMLPEMGPPETYIWEYPGDDKSWKSEYDDFLNCISKGEKINGNLYDAYKSLEIVDKVYFMNKK